MKTQLDIYREAKDKIPEKLSNNHSECNMTLWGIKGYRCNECGSGRLVEIFRLYLRCQDCKHEEAKSKTNKIS